MLSHRKNNGLTDAGAPFCYFVAYPHYSFSIPLAQQHALVSFRFHAPCPLSRCTASPNRDAFVHRQLTCAILRLRTRDTTRFIRSYTRRHDVACGPRSWVSPATHTATHCAALFTAILPHHISRPWLRRFPSLARRLTTAHAKKKRGNLRGQTDCRSARAERPKERGRERTPSSP